MNFMEKLLDGAIVEWQPLELVAKIKHGKDWKRLNEGDVPVYGSGGIMGYVDTSSYCEPTVLIPRKGSITNIFYVDTPFWNVDTIYYTEINTAKIVPKYLYHFIKTIDLMALDTGSGRPSLTQAILNKILVPIPCPENLKKSLEIQAEIVRILDAFTALTAELTAELSTRKKQYNYYRDQLLSFKDGEVECKTLAGIAEYSKTRINFERLDETNYVGVDNLLQNRAGKTESNYVPISGNLTEYRKGDILIGNIRPYLKKIWQAERVGGTNGDVLVIHPIDDTVNVRYLYHILADEKFFEYNMQHAKGAKMPRGSKDKIMEYRFQVPKNPDEQARIVAILDKFDALTSSITEGLPREIELRQKQYEYYRDLLLSFPQSSIQSH
ncbi:restriction endonuclease subunit S [Acinetobacter sp. ANC 4204]|uniref:restriction endonuclease subunit S n=1 Tax=Acinetobacter sp. ANC 4204 TaxID=1977884 RepID=UPI000A350AB4|nr:restriction endonuclease subunit S [Acinetobacter sp. ANC 4204]OTG59422.1 restriction endonuclease subunit S [Acinetobacter sp. ANC 4204]